MIHTKYTIPTGYLFTGDYSKMTPIETLIEGLKNMKADTLMRGGVNDYTKVAAAAFDKSIEHAQSLLPAEQQFNCEFAEWIGENGYEWTLDKGFYNMFKKDGTYYTTTELLQLFTNKNEGK